jgi:hypothetical protein
MALSGWYITPCRTVSPRPVTRAMAAGSHGSASLTLWPTGAARLAGRDCTTHDRNGGPAGVIDKTAEALNAIVLPIDATAQDMVCSFSWVTVGSEQAAELLRVDAVIVRELPDTDLHPAWVQTGLRKIVGDRRDHANGILRALSDNGRTGTWCSVSKGLSLPAAVPTRSPRVPQVDLDHRDRARLGQPTHDPRAEQLERMRGPRAERNGVRTNRTLASAGPHAGHKPRLSRVTTGRKAQHTRAGRRS